MSNEIGAEEMIRTKKLRRNVLKRDTNDEKSSNNAFDEDLCAMNKMRNTMKIR